MRGAGTERLAKAPFYRSPRSGAIAFPYRTSYIARSCSTAVGIDEDPRGSLYADNPSAIIGLPGS